LDKKSFFLAKYILENSLMEISTYQWSNL